MTEEDNITPTPANAPATPEPGEYQIIEGEPQIVSDKGQVNIYALARFVMTEHKFLTFTDEEGEVYHYDNGIYKPGGKPLIKQIIEQKIGQFATTFIVNEAVEHIKRSTYHPRSVIDDDSNLVCLENGVIDIQTGEFSPHSPFRVFLKRIPVYYEPGATCPTIDQFISEIVGPDDVPLMYEALAYTLVPGYPIQKAFMFVGAGNNGKSTFINMLQAFIGPGNCSKVTLQDIDKNRFAGADLYGKLANICADISSQELKRTSTFKGLTGGDPMRAEKKNQQAFDFQNRAKMMFSCNTVPMTDDDSTAFFRRWVIVDFPNRFEGPALKLDMLERLTTRGELSGLLNKILPLPKAMLENRGFCRAGNTEATRIKYIKLSDSVFCFVDMCCQVNNGCVGPNGVELGPGEVRKTDLYKAYVQFCQDEHLTARSDKVFNRKIQEHLPNINEVRVKEGGQLVRCWRGLDLLTASAINENKAQSKLFEY